MDASTKGFSGRGRNKRKWKNVEEDALLDFMQELKVDPRWRTEGGFKNGFMVVLEQKINEMFPTCGLKVVPHIESKIKWFKDKYAIICEMLRLSGFKWDSEQQMIQCEKQSYDDFCKNHPKVQGLWRTQFPYLEKLDIIFGADRAKGNEVEDLEEMVGTMENEYVTLDDDDVDLDDLAELSSPPSLKKQKKGTSSFGTSSKKNIVQTWANAMKDMSKHLETIAHSMAAGINRENELIEQKKQLLSEIALIPGISDDDAIEAARILAKSSSELDIFYSCPNEDWKARYINKLLHSTRGASESSGQGFGGD